MRALIIDGDKTFNQGLAFFLKGRGLAVDSAWTGADGADMAKYYDYDIILTDIMLPDMMGHDIIKRLRGTGITTPVMIVSNMAAIPTKLDCFGCGADDYVLKSCDKYEIFARVQAIVRRSHGAAESVITVGQMQVNLESKMVTVGGRPLHLTGKEYAILELLCLRRGMTVSKEQFLNHLYGGMDAPEIKIIDVFLFRVRRKIERLTGGKQYIRTAWGRGYILQDTSSADG